jgi:tRNA pseudouridine32 synthase/23S rRNA pseudouridine746 synthase/23S rRNA pseudouridine1911/1915/1917 synthase
MISPGNIIHQDVDLLVLNKPSGVSLLRDRGGEACLWDAIVSHCAEKSLGTPRTVHRLDKGTSGVLAVALSERAQKSLNRQFQAGTISKWYVARTVGMPEPRCGLVDLPLRPGRKSRYRVAGPREAIRCVSSPSGARWELGVKAEGGGHESQTRYRVLRAEGGGALVLLQPLTGRTHQLRVHMAWIGFPLLGDTLYGKPGSEEQEAERMALHCAKLCVVDDWSGSGKVWRVFRAGMPAFG